MKNIHEIKVVIEKEEWKEKVDKAFEKLQKNAKVDGFRKGKVPRNIFEKKNGKETIWYEAINDALDEKYLNILQEKKLIPIIRPNIEVVSVDDNKAEIILCVSKIKDEEQKRIDEETAAKKAKEEDKVIFGGRLGMYKYFDMHQVVDEALKCVRKELEIS